jgi:hypothetical protein
MPYIGVTYYERYAVPLLAVKVLLVIWAADRLLCLLFRDKPLMEFATGEGNESMS